MLDQTHVKGQLWLLLLFPLWFFSAPLLEENTLSSCPSPAVVNLPICCGEISAICWRLPMETVITPPINPCGSCMSLACLEHHQDVQFRICSFKTVAIRRCGRLLFCGNKWSSCFCSHPQSFFCFVLFFLVSACLTCWSCCSSYCCLAPANYSPYSCIFVPFDLIILVTILTRRHNTSIFFFLVCFFHAVSCIDVPDSALGCWQWFQPGLLLKIWVFMILFLTHSAASTLMWCVGLTLRWGVGGRGQAERTTTQRQSVWETAGWREGWIDGYMDR